MPDTRVNFDLATALKEAERRFIAANPESERRYRKAAEAMPGGNTRTVLYYSPFPTTFRKGEGATLTDVDGHVYTDFLGEYSAGIYGHSHPKIMAAAERALKAGIVLGGPNEYEAELELLARHVEDELKAAYQIAEKGARHLRIDAIKSEAAAALSSGARGLPELLLRCNVKIPFFSFINKNPLTAMSMTTTANVLSSKPMRTR